MDICPTGYTTIKTTYTAPAWSGKAKPEVPYGWTTTVTVGKNCAPYPTTVTLTKPMATYPVSRSTPAAPEKYVSSAPVKPVAVSSASYMPLPYVSVVNGSAIAYPSYTSSVNVKPAVTSKYAAAGTGTPAYTAPYSKFTGAGGKESVSVVALFGALIFAIL